MHNRGILITLRAAAIVIIVTGLNDVIASAVPRYEPLYLYLAATALVALTDGILFGIAAGVLSVAFYALLFMSRADALSAAILVPAGAALGVAVVGAAIRALFRRRRKPAPAYPSRPPLLETSSVAQVTDNAEVLAAIDGLRNELRAAIADLSVARGRENELADRTRSHGAELEAMETRIRQFEHDRDWAVKLAEENRVAAERERGLRAAAERLLAEMRDESSTMAGRLAELELSSHESERTRADAAELRHAADRERARADAERVVRERVERDLVSAREQLALQRQAAADSVAQARRIEELERALGETRAAREILEKSVAGALPFAEAEELRRALADTRTSLRQAATDAVAQTRRADELQRTVAEERAVRQALEKALAAMTPPAEVEALRRRAERADSALAEERAAREKLEEQARGFDAKLQTLATHLASDHETDLGQAMTDKEAARAEARALAAKLERAWADEHAAREELEKVRASAIPSAEVDALRRTLAETRDLQRQAEVDAAAQRQRADAADLAHAEERAAREKLEEEARSFDSRLQTIVTHLASDHETDLGQALSDKEEARAEARALSMKLSALQRRYDEDAMKLQQLETLLAETRSAAQLEIDRLRMAAATPHSARPRVMIVHPDSDLRAAASTTLERAGYEVVTAADGLEALRVAIARQPDVVIAETSMPKMDGRELCQLLKSQEKTAHIRVILLMRASDEEPRGDLPPDEILRKPVPVETLKATLANLLSSRA